MVSGGAPLGGDEVMRTEPPVWSQGPCEGDPRELPHPFLQVRTQWEDAVCAPGSRSSLQRLCWHPRLGRAASRAVRNQCLLFTSCQVSSWSLEFHHGSLRGGSLCPSHSIMSWLPEMSIPDRLSSACCWDPPGPPTALGEPWCKLWTLSDGDVSTMVQQL